MCNTVLAQFPLRIRFSSRKPAKVGQLYKQRSCREGAACSVSKIYSCSQETRVPPAVLSLQLLLDLIDAFRNVLFLLIMGNFLCDVGTMC